MPENETPSGPNYPRTYRISADVANGQTISGMIFTDLLPTSIIYQGISASSPGTPVIISQPPLNTPLTSANNTLQVRFPSVMGTV